MAQTDAFIKLRIGTAAAWTLANPILLSGEKGIESDTLKEKVGDGATVWTSLGYQLGKVVPENAVFTDTTYSVGDGGLTEINFTTTRKDKLDVAAVLNVAQTFTAAQGTSTTEGDNSIAFNDSNNHTLTATAAQISVTNQTKGKGGTITISSAENITGWTSEYTWGDAGEPTGLTDIEYLEYKVLADSGADSILIGRV